ncbi:flagellar protein FlaG [Pseudomonas xionganensis]|uniref:Flagellar biosynthesis protein FlaG n=1 Tax=Pseudomonas xionganensis TaxID=2654845 RepID=A0A6I4KZP1_9PSED|nr:flagellar protein FlaG [Pseudomonas xionganensis]MVW76272.1 flagellar biosynthesis protein FlaG [Pseudomonas xionganensis]
MDIGSIQNSLNAAAATVKGERDSGPAAKFRAVAGEPEAQTPAADQAPKTAMPAEASREEVEAAVATIQDFVQSVRRSLNFSLEEGSGRVVVKVTDAGSGDIIRQIPSEEALQLAENLSEVRSLLFKAEA